VGAGEDGVFAGPRRRGGRGGTRAKRGGQVEGSQIDNRHENTG